MKIEGKGKEKRYLFLLIISGLIFFGSCQEDVRPDSKLLVEAEVRDWGSPSVDGCGWVIQISSDSIYSPINLAEDFKVHELKVLIDFKETGEDWVCGFPVTNHIPEIKILNIRRP